MLVSLSICEVITPCVASSLNKQRFIPFSAQSQSAEKGIIVWEHQRCDGLALLGLKSERKQTHLLEHSQKSVATGGREMLAQSDGVDEIEFGVKDF